MSDGCDTPAVTSLEAFERSLVESTPARILCGRAGTGYLTATQLRLRADHSAAVDAVAFDPDPLQLFGHEFLARWNCLSIATSARSRAEYLRRPDLGRRLPLEETERLKRECPTGPDLLVAIGDGLSAIAVQKQAPALLPLLAEGCEQRRWSWGRPVVVRYCRVGVFNDLGECLDPSVVVLLIGERPGLATAESLSAYMAFRPRNGRTDAHRNLISNIHERGVSTEEAAARILALAEKMRAAEMSGVQLKE